MIMSAKAEIREWQATVRIEPNVLYRRAEIRSLLGARFLNRLTRAGLRAISGWYSGKVVLETVERVWQEGNCQRVSGEEVDFETKHAENDRVEESGQNRTAHPVSERRRTESLLRQMEEVG